MNNFSSPFMAKSPLNQNKQSLQTKYKKFKAKAGRKVRNFFGESETPIKPRQGVGQETNKHQSTDGNASLIEVPVNSNTTAPDKTGYYKAMEEQNDSLKALPEDDLNHLPSFDITTDKGLAAAKKFYTQDGKNDKLRRLQKMGKALRSKYGL